MSEKARSNRSMPRFPSNVSVGIQKDGHVQVTFSEKESEESYTFILSKDAAHKLATALLTDQTKIKPTLN